MNTKLLKSIFRRRYAKQAWYLLRRLIPARSNGKPPPQEARSFVWGRAPVTDRHALPRLVWSFWNGQESPTVTACQKSWKTHLGGYRIHALTLADLPEHLPGFPDLPPHTPIQKVSNLIRLMLLERHGGIWMDASTLVTKPLDWVEEALDSTGSEAMLFYNEFHDEYESDHRRPIIENGFIAALPQSSFIADWRRTYLDCVQSSDYRKFFRSRDDFERLTRNFKVRAEEHLSYFVCYVAAQHVMLQSNNYRLHLVNAEDDYYFNYYKTAPPRSRWRFAENLLLDKEPSRLPNLVKVTGGHRAVVDEYIRFRCYRNNSTLGRYMN